MRLEKYGKKKNVADKHAAKSTLKGVAGFEDEYLSDSDPDDYADHLRLKTLSPQ